MPSIHRTEDTENNQINLKLSNYLALYRYGYGYYYDGYETGCVVRSMVKSGHSAKTKRAKYEGKRNRNWEMNDDEAFWGLDAVNANATAMLGISWTERTATKHNSTKTKSSNFLSDGLLA